VGEPARRPLAIEVSEKLDGLAQAHVVGQNPAQSGLGEELQPGEAFLLVWAQFGEKRVRRLDGLESLEGLDHAAQLADGFGQSRRRGQPGDLCRGKRAQQHGVAYAAVCARSRAAASPLRPVRDHAGERLQAVGVQAQHLLVRYLHPEHALRAVSRGPCLEAARRYDGRKQRR
jgi:hypothetical protein